MKRILFLTLSNSLAWAYIVFQLVQPEPMPPMQTLAACYQIANPTVDSVVWVEECPA